MKCLCFYFHMWYLQEPGIHQFETLWLTISLHNAQGRGGCSLVSPLRLSLHHLITCYCTCVLITTPCSFVLKYKHVIRLIISLVDYSFMYFYDITFSLRGSCHIKLWWRWSFLMQRLKFTHHQVVVLLCCFQTSLPLAALPLWWWYLYNCANATCHREKAKR